MNTVRPRVLIAITLLALAGCQARVLTFPAAPTTQRNLPAGGRLLGYDTNHDGAIDYTQTLGPAGQVVRLSYAGGETVDLAAVDRAACPHLVILLDGANADLLATMRTEGHFRLFPPTCLTVAPFPVMTDLALNQLLHTGPSVGYEARYFDRARNRQIGGLGDYVAADNSPWLARTDYRISFRRDADAYLKPRQLFHDELAGMDRLFARAAGPATRIGYTVGTAGMGTRNGAAGMRQYLAEVDRWCEQIVWQRHGRVSITIASDHGQDLVAGRRVTFAKYLEKKGWRVARSLRADRDVVEPEYGLVTYAAFNTRSPAKLADDLAAHPAVDLVMYPAGQGVVVRKGTQRALVRRAASRPDGDERFFYTADQGDPLELLPILARLPLSDDGIAESALFGATINHVYPDPLKRIWFAFHGVVTNPADVLVSLRDEFHHGSSFFEFFIDRASTHGSLRRASSRAFVMSTRAALPAELPQDRILERLGVRFEAARR